MSITKYEVEKNTDLEGGVYFKNKEDAIKYYEEQILFCLQEKKEQTCDDFVIFNHIQLNEHKADEITILKSKDIN